MQLVLGIYPNDVAPPAYKTSKKLIYKEKIMNRYKRSGQSGFVFTECPDLRTLPKNVLSQEEQLHGGFATDSRPNQGYIYYGMPGCGLLRISPDLTVQELIELPTDLVKINFHSTKIGTIDGDVRLFLPANENGMVAVVTLDGEVDFILPRPEVEPYMDAQNPFRPTDVILNDGELLVSDGYGANYISTVNLSSKQWNRFFGGKTEDANVHGKFGTAHGVNRSPADGRLVIADRPNSRLEVYTFDGHYKRTHRLANGSRPCGINYTRWNERWYAVVGSLDDPNPDRPAPIYILDAETYELISTIRPKEELGIEKCDHLHNVIWHQHDGKLFLVCQSWNPGHYFVLEHVQ